MGNQDQVKNNVGSVAGALDAVVVQAHANADWNEQHGATFSPAALRAVAVSVQSARDTLTGILEGQEDIVGVQD